MGANKCRTEYFELKANYKLFFKAKLILQLSVRVKDSTDRPIS